MALKDHLDEYYHVFHNDMTGRLYVNYWTRDTAADGYWLNENTVKPLSARDVYLAECLEELSASTSARYKPGYGIIMEPYTDSIGDNTYSGWYISVDETVAKKVKPYEIAIKSPIMTISEADNHVQNINFNFDPSTVTIEDKEVDLLSANDDGGLTINTTAISSRMTSTATSAYTYTSNSTAFTYTYNTAAANNYVLTSELPVNPNNNTIYIIY